MNIGSRLILSKIRRRGCLFFYLAMCLALSFLGTNVAAAQDYVYQTGSPAFSVAQPVPFGFVNVANGNVHLEIPLASAPQRGKLGFTAKMVYDGRIWQIVNSGGSLLWKPTNVPNSIAGWRFVTTADPGSVTFTTLTDQDCAGNQNKTSFIDFVWQDPEGTRRKFNLATAKDPGCPEDVSAADGYALDSSGYHMFITNYNQAVVFAKDGTQVSPTLQDTNGNYFSTDANGNVIDTLGRTVVTKTVNGNQTYYDVLNSQGATSRYTLTTSSILVNTNFSASQSGITDDQENITVVSSLGLPNGDTYTFAYDTAQPTGQPGLFTAGYGLLTSVTHSAMGQIESFGYESFVDAFGVVNRWVTNSFDSTISYQVCPNSTTSTVTCQTATLTRNGGTVAYIFSMQPGGAWNTSTTARTSGGGLIASITNTYDFSQSCATCSNPVFVTLQNARTTVNGLTAQTAYSYDSPSSANVTLVQNWNYYKGDATAQPPATPDHQTAISYSSDAGLIANHITNRVSSITEQDGSGNQLAQTLLSYDSTPLTQLLGTISNLNASVNSHRGNLTQISRWTGGTSFLNTLLTYDSSGQLVQVKDPAGNIVKISYADKFYKDDGNNPPASFTPSQTTNAYPTTITIPDGTLSSGYYYGSGKPALATDLNNQTTYQHYIDSLDRLTQVVAPKGWQQMAYTSINTVDLYAGITVANPSTTCTGCSHEQSVFDVFGHLVADTLVSDPAGAVSIGYLRDIMGNVLAASNPTRNTTQTPPQTKISYDVLYRPTQQANPDGSVAQVTYGFFFKQLCASATYGFGVATLATDEMGKQQQVLRDGFGRVIEVDEPDATGALTVPTCYQYNTAGELTQVVQGGLTRSYQYDPLWRVTQVTTPEGGTETYSYLNDDGTLCSGDPSAVCKRVDARGTATHYQYDSSSRLTQKTYSDGTPKAIFHYNETSALGVSLANTLGRPSSIATQDGTGKMLTGEVFSYDAVGNIINNSQCTPQNCGTGVFQNTYVLDQLGNVTNFNNSWGRNLTMAFNNAVQITSLTASQSDSTHPASLFANPKYNEFGSLISATLGNGLEEAYGFSKVTGRFNSARIGTSTPFDVPAPGNSAAPGTGSITISGAVQQKSSTAAPGSATLSVTGGERQVANGTQPAQPSTVTFTIAGSEQVTQNIENLSTSGSGAVVINGGQQLWVKLPIQPEVDANTSFGVGGTLASTVIGAHGATPATGSVTISGTQRTKLTSTRFCEEFSTRGTCLVWGSETTTTYDSGTVTITVNGQAYTYNYGVNQQTDNVTTISSNLQTTINNNSPYVSVTNVSVNTSISPPTATIYLQSRNAGSANNFSLSASTTYDTADFSFASFSTSTSGAALSGGTDPFAGNTVYDTGTVSVSFTTYPSIDLNPKTYSATAKYGNGSGLDSSGQAIAADLSQQFAAQGSPVRVSASSLSSSLQFTAPSGGAGNALVVSCSSATNSPNFSAPSFTCPSQTGLHLGIFNQTLFSYDSGSVNLSVGNYTASVNYGYLGSNTQWSSINLSSVMGAQPDSLPVGFASSPTAALVNGVSTPPPATDHIFYLSKGHVHELYTDSSGQFHDQDDTAASGGATAGYSPYGAGLTAFAGNTSFPEHVFYIDTNGHVHEMYSDSNGNWHDQDNSALAGAPAATVNSLTHPLAGFLVSFAGAGLYPEHVFYTDASSHVHELLSDTSGQWHQQDITAASGAPAFNCSLTGFYAVNSSSPEHVLFIDANGHVQEMYADTKGFWHSQDITATGNLPNATCGQATQTFMVSYGSCSGAGEHVFFINGDLYHLWNDSSGWHAEDVSIATGMNTVANGLTGFCDTNTGSPFVFGSTRSPNVLALWKDSAGWHTSSLSGGGPPSGAFFDGIGAHIPFFGNSGIAVAESATGSPANIASALVNNASNGLGLSNSPVTPTLSGNTINLAAKKTGLSSNYPLALSSTYSTGFFSQPSFTGTYAPTMTGGTDAVSTPLYDSGTISLIVNKHTDEVAWGLTSTTQSIASELATLVNLDAGSPVTATVSGNVILTQGSPPTATVPGTVITLTSKATGASTNYPISAAITNDSADFSNSSFGAQFDVPPQPTNMHGGQDANGAVWDTGSITVAINGFTKTVPYNQNSTNIGLQAAIINAFNSDPNSPVWACVCPASSGLVTFTAKKPGSNTNYTISAASATNNGNFMGTSFPVTLSGATLTGGADSGGSQSTVSDSGIVSLTVGSFTASVDYGQSSNATSGVPLVCCSASAIATALANVLNQSSNSPVIASANGGQLTLISTTGGSATNYSLSASSQGNDTTDFSSPSFTFSPASGVLAGGADKPNAALGSSSIAAIAITQTAPWQDPNNTCDVRLDVIVNSYDYSTCIGSGTASTAAAFAAQVAQSINHANSLPQTPGYVSATASGSTVYLQSTIGGSRTNYPIQAIVRTFNGVASPISVAVSGSTMTGGTDNGGFVYALDLETDYSGQVAAANDSVNGNWSYLYDYLDRLEKAFTPANSYSYDYDVYGNRLHQTPLNGGNSLSLTYVNNQISATGIQYDASGNMIADGTHTYGYDAEGRLISVDGGQTASYVYGADGLRVRSTVGANFYDFIHDESGETVGVLGANGVLVRQEMGGFATFNSTGTFFHHRDWLGNLRVITDQTGTIQATCTNLPYGDALSCAANGITPLAFTGYMRDSESNLDFANARYYTSQFGRFMSPDPLGGVVGDPQSLNRYAYVLNSPLSAVDPSGMGPCPPGLILCFSGSDGGGGSGPFGGGGGPFAGGGTGFGGGGFGFCTLLDCGLGGGSGPSIPGPPSTAQISAEQIFGREFNIGAAKEYFNTIKGLFTLNPYFSSVAEQIPDLEASNSNQRVGMRTVFIATLLVPGEGEEAAAGKVEEVLRRFGTSRESLSRLARKAAEAEAKIGIHGVSTTAGRAEGGVSSALRSRVEEFFTVHDTPTKNDPLHRTVELPKPLSQQIVDIFNRIFGRS